MPFLLITHTIIQGIISLLLFFVPAFIFPYSSIDMLLSARLLSVFGIYSCILTGYIYRKKSKKIDLVVVFAALSVFHIMHTIIYVLLVAYGFSGLSGFLIPLAYGYLAIGCCYMTYKLHSVKTHGNTSSDHETAKKDIASHVSTTHAHEQTQS